MTHVGVERTILSGASERGVLLAKCTFAVHFLIESAPAMK